MNKFSHLAVLEIFFFLFFVVGSVMTYGQEGITVQLTLNTHPENTLMVNASVITSDNARVAIRFKSTNTDQQRTGYSELATDHEMTVVGLRADTTYRFTAVALLETGERVRSEVVEFKTGPQPTGVPRVELLNQTASSEGGITIFAPSADRDSTFYGFDEAGELVWYLHGNVPLSGAPVARNLHDGRLLLLLDGEARIISYTGEILSTFALPAYHHDVQLLENGNLLVLINETGFFAGNFLQGDAIIEIDTSGNTVWEWSAFDHMDTDRFPGALANRILSNGALDWTHSNALYYIPENKSILLSSRSQSWVVNIDHLSGDVNWVMGRDIDVTAGLADKFFTLDSGNWMASQHAAMLTGSDEILIYDNRNESELSGNIYNSRAVKFKLNKASMTAEQTWEFVAPKYTQSLGDVDELPGGNILLCAGGPSDISTGSDRNAYLVEVTQDEIPEVTWQLKVSDTTIYRAERIRWSELLE
ncbi:aryl-sulfate sulfotransferase [Microbulbifer echini]|uniref:Aryl-sulfate sulfotransferase n=1 Tax=Microbulbifer echini TaxID=1529067 RepID=A0ABV4NJA6_9GAMM|nr:aryl-sulfate sulfotransferase [uncultured Microbulbifer sp.]